MLSLRIGPFPLHAKPLEWFLFAGFARETLFSRSEERDEAVGGATRMYSLCCGQRGMERYNTNPTSKGIVLHAVPALMNSM